MTKRRVKGKGNFLRTGNPHQPFMQLAIQIVGLLWFISSKERIDAHNVSVFGVEAEVLRSQIVQAAQQQSRRAQQDH